MKEEEKIKVNLLFISLIVAVFTLIAGIFIGLSLAKKEVYLIGIKENQIKAEILELEATLRFLNENICEDKVLQDFSVDLDKVGQRLESLQNRLFINRGEYESLKRFYYTLEVEHYFLLKKAEKRCNKNFVFIFYFYKPIEKCPLCFKQGVYLTILKEKFLNQVQIYSFDKEDFNKSILLKKIMLKYGIDPNLNEPELVINEKKYKFLEKEELEKLVIEILKNKGSEN
ncbi:MAG TPA: hypothetical protein EYH54_02225 [Nautiliaceae bacterium]|nr:hypothetical protein [Nautiliaceae bacterium]